MKLIVAIIKPIKLGEVQEALGNAGVKGMTVTEVTGYGHQRGHRDYHGIHHTVKFLPKVRIEVAVSDEQADTIIETITRAARTGQIGDGKIFVTPLEHAVRIRTGEADLAAL